MIHNDQCSLSELLHMMIIHSNDQACMRKTTVHNLKDDLHQIYKICVNRPSPLQFTTTLGDLNVAERPTISHKINPLYSLT